MHDWDTSLPATCDEMCDNVRDAVNEAMECVMSVIGEEIKKDLTCKEERAKEGRKPAEMLVVNGKTKKWVRCKDGRYRNVEELGNY